MPNYKGHLVGGFITFLGITRTASMISETFSNNLSFNNTFLYASVCMIGSLFPDIDTKSKIQRYFYIIFFLIITYLIILKEWTTISILTPIILLPLIVHHRGIFHKFWFSALVSISILALIQSYSYYNLQHAAIAVLFFMAGWISHIILDYGFWRFLYKKMLKKHF